MSHNLEFCPTVLQEIDQTALPIAELRGLKQQTITFGFEMLVPYRVKEISHLSFQVLSLS